LILQLKNYIIVFVVQLVAIEPVKQLAVVIAYIAEIRVKLKISIISNCRRLGLEINSVAANNPNVILFLCKRLKTNQKRKQ
jgi:hypothetical protein